MIELSNINCIPVWDKEEIILFDMYTKDGVWLGSKRLFKYVLEIEREWKLELKY